MFGAVALGFLMASGVASCGDDDDSVIDYTKPDPEPEAVDSTDNPTTEEPKMSIFLCFGQSNMEGNAAVEDQDRVDVPSNFKNMIVAKGDADHYGAARYTWRKADPPLARFTTGLTPADYFGRKMVEKLGADHEVGIVMVAIGGASIEAFEKDKCKEYCSRTDHADWYKNYLAEYDNNPYGVLVTAAKAAQKSGVIRGILLHQGETNNTDPTWPETVKAIYNNLLTDLGLDAAKCPLLAGEMLRQEEGGICWGHNAVIATLPTVIPTSYVISSEGCKGNGVDGFHFCAEGYRILGERYAAKMISVMNK